MTTTVHVQDVRTGRVHVRFQVDGEHGLYATEHETAGTSGAFIVLTDAEFERIDPEALCQRCFAQEAVE